jgi:dolichol-phosphate mannosyltransferase
MSEKVLVIIPTYNEADNIGELIDSVLSVQNNIDVLVVDDNSPDKTWEVVEGLRQENSRIHLIRRNGKLGLGTAYVEGFKYALKNNFDYIFQMDADFSHNPKNIPDFLEKIKEYDLVIGSRYKNGVRVVNWPIKRLILSFLANVYTRVITGMPVADATGGYKCFRKEVFAALDLDRIKSNGYAFQIELNFKTYKKGFRLLEIPIVFEDRRVGISKMSKRIIIEAIFRVWGLRVRSLLRIL